MPATEEREKSVMVRSPAETEPVLRVVGEGRTPFRSSPLKRSAAAKKSSEEPRVVPIPGRIVSPDEDALLDDEDDDAEEDDWEEGDTKWPYLFMARERGPARVIMNAHKELIFYPESDDKPMAEAPEHLDAMQYLIANIRLLFAERGEMAYTVGNNFLYYKKDAPSKRVSPDVYSVKGVPNDMRASYKTWEEDDKVPSIVFELTSRKTKHKDEHHKRYIYRRMGVREYILFDPLGEYLKPRLQWFHWTESGKQFRRYKAHNGQLFSEALGMNLVVSGNLLRLVDPTTGHKMPSTYELYGLHKDAERQREDAERQRDASEAENARLRAQVEALLKERAGENL